MKGETSSIKAYHNIFHERLIEDHPRIFDLSLILGLIILIGLAAFLMSDILSFGPNAAHKEAVAILGIQSGGQSMEQFVLGYLAKVKEAFGAGGESSAGRKLPAFLSANGSNRTGQNLSLAKNASGKDDPVVSSNLTGNSTATSSRGASGVSSAGKAQPKAIILISAGSDDSSGDSDSSSSTPPAKPASRSTIEQNESLSSRSLLNESSVNQLQSSRSQINGSSINKSSINQSQPRGAQLNQKPRSLSSDLQPAASRGQMDLKKNITDTPPADTAIPQKERSTNLTSSDSINSSSNSSDGLAAPAIVQTTGGSGMLPTAGSMAAANAPELGKQPDQAAGVQKADQGQPPADAEDKSSQTLKKLTFPSQTEGTKKAGGDQSKRGGIVAPASKTKKKLQDARNQLATSKDKPAGSTKKKSTSSRSPASRARDSRK